MDAKLSKFINFLNDQCKLYAKGTPEQVVEKFNQLVADGIDIAQADKDGNTILHAFAGSQSFLKYTPELVDVIKRAVEMGCSLTTQNSEGNTPMHCVVYPIGIMYNDKFFNLAITMGGVAAFNIQNNEGDTPLHRYAKRGLIEFWNATIEHGENLNPYIRNKEGHTPQEAAIAHARAGLTKAGYDQLIKRMVKTLAKFPNPKQTDAVKEPETPPVWKINEDEKNQIPKVRGELLFPVEESLFYTNFFPVDNQSAIITTNEFFIALNLLDGSIRWKQRRWQMDTIRYQTAKNGVWYAGVDDDGTAGAVIAINPLKGFDLNTGQSVWKTLIGSSSYGPPCVTAEITPTTNHVFFNTSSAFMAVDNKSGKLLWRAKPKGREWATPVVWGNHVYTSCKSGKEYILAAFDIKTGKEDEKENIKTKYALGKQLKVPSHFPPRWFRAQKPIVHKDVLYYFTHEFVLAGIDMNTKQTIMEVQLAENKNPYFVTEDIDVFIDKNDVLHLLTQGNLEIIARVDLNKKEMLPEPEYVFDREEREFYELKHLTKDHIYALKQDSKTEKCFVCITSRETGKEQYRVELPKRKITHEDETFKSILTESGILYTYRYMEIKKKPHIEILMIY